MKKNIIGGLIGLALLLPGVASATVNELEELRARINSLLAIVAQLQSQLASQTGASEGAFCFTFNTDLKIGDRGSGTGYLHKALEREGFSIPDSEKPQKDGETINDSFFGEATASRVSAFQEKYRSEILTPAGLSNGTGYLGARTRAKLNQLYGCNQTPCTDVTGSRCAYIENPNWYPKPIAMCDYPAPPENCKYVDGPNFNPTTQCGKILSCSTTINPIACTLEAKLCSDGKTYVGRTGPKCEFSACPNTTNTLKIVSPNGGERWETGNIYTISWAGTSASPDYYVGRVALYKGNDFVIDLVPFMKRSLLNGFVQYKVPATNVLGHDFRVQAILYKGDSEIIQDWSDGYFSIISPTTD